MEGRDAEIAHALSELAAHGDAALLPRSITSSFVLTLTTYADYIREDDTAAPNFARPSATATDRVLLMTRRAR